VSERARAVTIATAALDRWATDHDDDLAVLSRQFLRCIDRAAIESEARDAARTGSLDVERLAEAMWNVERVKAGWSSGYSWEDIGEGRDSMRREAAPLAAEYAALSKEERP